MSLETRITALAQAIAADIKAARAGLAGKAASGANTDITSITGSAAKLTTARTVATSGDASGSASFDGSANVTIPLTLAGTGIAAGTYGLITVDAKGRATAGTIITPIANGGTGASTAAGALANLGAQAALGFTPENTANKGKANGYASLDASGLVPAAQLPSYVDDVLEYSAASAFPATGEAGKIYVALDTGKLYRWSGSAYVYITSGAVDSVNGKTGVVVLGKVDIGLGNVDNTADAAKSVASAAKLTTARTLATTGDATGSASFDGTTNVSIGLTLAASGVTAGTYGLITVDAKGRATAGTTISPIANGGTGASTAAGALTNLGAQAALGFTPENAANKGKANGYASLDASGLVPASQLPSYVDDVLEYSALSAFPSTGEAGKIYVALDTGKLYRWSGSAYVYITSGAVDSVNGKTGVVALVKGDIGLGSVDNTADASKSVASAAKLTTARTLATTGDATGSASFDGTTNVSIGLTLAASGVTAGTYVVTTVDAKGRVTAGRALQAGDIPAHSAALLTSGTLNAARLPASGVTAGEYAVATFDAYGRATGGRALQVSDLPPSQVAGTWGVIAADNYGRVTAGRAAVASDITGGTFAIGRLPVVGSVSQFNGQPTGAIIETGTNSNGTWTRFADGTQICHGLVGTAVSQVTQQAATGYHQYVGTPTYPAQFVAPPRVMLGLAQASYYYGAAMTDAPPSATQTGSVYLWSPSNSFRGQAAYTAVGRWF